jgi:glycosyltransferase involved in cell wall biosynthesis
MVANMTPYKDHETLLRAWQPVMETLSARNQSALLVLVGRLGPTYPALHTLARNLHVERSVRFLGVVDDISGLLDVLDIGVLSSLSEGSPNAVLEYMAAGLPVVATDIPSIRQVLGNQANACLVRPKDVRSFADQLLSFLGDPQRRATVGRANQQRSRQFYALEAMHRKMVQIIKGELVR